jgi:hypothetical protein
MAHPLLDTFRPLDTRGTGGELEIGIEIGRQDGPGWSSAAALLADPAAFDAVVAELARSSGTDRSDINGAFLLSDWGYAVLLRSAVAFLAARRVPVLDHAGTWLRVDPEHWIDRVSFAGPLACLEGDSCAGDPDARPVASEDELLAQLVTGFHAHQEPIVALVHERCRRPRAALWRHSGDTLAEAFLWAGEILDAREEAWAWGQRAVDLAPARLRTHAGYRLFDHAGLRQVGRVRAQCCLNYRCTPSSYCFSCPLQDDGHRLRRIERRAKDAAAA